MNVRDIINDIQRQVAEIALHGNLIGDNEAAHRLEDSLYERVIRILSEDHGFTGEEVRWIATETLQTKTINYQRWIS